MKRKDFIRNMLMGFAATLLPKVLLPSDGETEEVAYEVKYMMGNTGLNERGIDNKSCVNTRSNQNCFVFFITTIAGSEHNWD